MMLVERNGDLFEISLWMFVPSITLLIQWFNLHVGVAAGGWKNGFHVMSQRPHSDMSDKAGEQHELQTMNGGDDD